MLVRTLTSRAGFSAVSSRHTVSRAMPLSAKMTNQQQSASYTRTFNWPLFKTFKPKPEDDPEDVIFNSIFGLRTIELNRPSVLNSLNGSMLRKIMPRMVEWEESDMANVVVLKGNGRALCAGGDIVTLAQEIQQNREEGVKRASEFFATEYQLDHYIATYQKPLVAFMDGITMGGGVGLSMHAPLRIATENTLFAMPETKIGLYPDVGASFFLPRMNGAIGTYLALTSERLKGVNAYYSGIATHFVDSTLLHSLEARLAELRFRDYDKMETRLSLISRTIDEFATGLPHDEFVLSGELRTAIDRCFSRNTVAGIIAALEAETGVTRDWAQSTLQSLHERSPLSVHIALRQMRISRSWSIAETFQREHAMSIKCMAAPDFAEGAIKLLVDKGESPKWTPASLEDIAKSSEDLTANYFLLPDEKMQLIAQRDYREYPYSKFGVPTEKEIRELVESTDLSPEEIEKTVVKSRNSRQGIKLVVQEITSRFVTADKHGRAQWVEGTVSKDTSVVDPLAAQQAAGKVKQEGTEGETQAPAQDIPISKL